LAVGVGAESALLTLLFVLPACRVAVHCTADHTAFADCIPAWEKSGVKVIQVYSNDGADGSKYIQDVFQAQPGLDGADKAGVGVVLCGHKDMCNAVKDIVAASGVDADKVLLNF
jgi:hypothetical protein